MNLEQTLTDELRSIAATTQAPPPPALGDLVRGATRARRRAVASRLGAVGLVAAAVVAAIVLGSQIGRPNATPSPAKPTPSYYAPGVPYVYAGKLYVGHEATSGNWYAAQSGGHFTVAQATDTSAAILRDGVRVEKIPGPVYAIGLSADGTKAAWIQGTDTEGGVLVVRDLPGSRDLGRLPLRLPPTARVVNLPLAIADDGTAYYQVAGSWKWNPAAGTPVHVGHESVASPENPAPGFAGIGAFVRLSPDHLWGAWVTDRRGHEIRDLDVGKAVAVTVQRPNDPGSRFSIPLPPGVQLDATVAYWQSPTVVTMPVSPGHVQCDIVARRCRADGPTTP